ncbi:MAG: type II toxin-antitoxin system death-on-curing family toxin [Saprospiraceae bacterium]|nr:type II toxin-antitoxin system death-on-curing family toxin [Saprospiraceae bacterium]
MIEVYTALAIHSNIVRESGGADGVRELGLLESALSRPFQTFDGNDLYPDTLAKGAALLESIVKNHPFIDGNKRTGYVLMHVLLLDDGKTIQATEDQKYDLVIAVAEGRMDFGNIVSWLQEHAE